MTNDRDTIIISLNLNELSQIEKSVASKVAEGKLPRPYDFLSYWQMEATDQDVTVMIGLFESMVCTHLLAGPSPASDRLRKARTRLIENRINKKNAPITIPPSAQSKSSAPSEKFASVALEKNQMQLMCQCMNMFDPLSIAYGYMSHWIKSWMQSPDGSIIVPVTATQTNTILLALNEYGPQTLPLVDKFVHARRTLLKVDYPKV